MVIKLTDAYLCLDCQAVFSIRDYDTCPICCNKWVLSLGRIMNRADITKEVRENGKENKN
jgi:rRNA maturation endonuclease Nob1